VLSGFSVDVDPHPIAIINISARMTNLKNICYLRSGVPSITDVPLRQVYPTRRRGEARGVTLDGASRSIARMLLRITGLL
jgi:hypothetical protein